MISREEAEALKRPFYHCESCNYIDHKKKIPDAKLFWANPRKYLKPCPKCGSDDYGICGI